MGALTKKEYYPWWSRDGPDAPWEREYTDQDFLKTERTRIEEAEEWRKQFRKADNGDELGEVTYYAVPTDLGPAWLDAIRQHGDFIVKGLSAVRNDLQLPLVALFPHDSAPPNYSLVRITEARKRTILSDSPNQESGLYTVEVEDFHVQPVDHVYKDVPFEKQLVQDIFYRNLGYNETRAKSLQSPLLSSPFTAGKFGGVGLTSLMDSGTTTQGQRRKFVGELENQLQRMLPPEYRAVNPPTRMQKGEWMRVQGHHNHRVKFKVAEKITAPNARVSTDSGSSYTVIDNNTQVRHNFQGEYSFVGTLIPKGSQLELLDVTLKKFTKTEITAFDLHQMREADINLQHLQRDIPHYEDLHITIAHARQHQPTFDRINLDKWQSRLETEWERLLPEMGFEDHGDFEVENRAERTLDNLKRVAQSHARSNERENVRKEDMREAYMLFKTSAEDFLDHDITQQAKQQVKHRREQRRIESIKTILETGNYTTDELWQKLKDTDYYDDREDFESVLHWLEKKGKIYTTQDDRVGGV